MRVLVACEFSGVVRRAFRTVGHDAWSCDLLPAKDNAREHIQGDVLQVLNDGWDMMIAHPPCTHLAVSGARWFHLKVKEQAEAIDFVLALAGANIPKIAIENPVGVLSTRWRKPDQIVHPWMFGDSASKQTCLWLKNLPLLKATNLVDKGAFHVTKSGRRLPAWYNLPPSKDRAAIRSTTFGGMAVAMATQWST
jgi:hypothetical protein